MHNDRKVSLVLRNVTHACDLMSIRSLTVLPGPTWPDPTRLVLAYMVSGNPVNCALKQAALFAISNLTFPKQ